MNLNGCQLPGNQQHRGPTTRDAGRAATAIFSCRHIPASYVHQSVVTGILLAILTGWTSVCSAAEITTLKVGFKSAGRVGSFLPISVTAEGLPPGRSMLLQVTAPDPRGNLCNDHVDRDTVSAEGLVVLSGTFATGRMDGQVRVALVNSETAELLIEQTVRVQELKSGLLSERIDKQTREQSVDTTLHVVRQSTHGLLTIGSIEATQELQTTLSGPAGSQPLLLTCIVPSEDAFPRTLSALQSIDTIVLKGENRLDAEQTRALLNWVSGGGHLVVTAASDIGDFLETELGQHIQPLFLLRPETINVRDLSALQNYVPGAVQLSTNRRNVPMARVTSDQVRSIVSSLDGPLISRTALHGGVVTMVAVELDERPLNTWKTLPRLYEMLIFDDVQDTSTTSRGRNSRISSSGISDLSTQLDAVCDAIPPRQRWSSWHIMVIMLVYLVIIGPLDYLLVTRILRRPHLTWLTFPVLIAGACGIVFWQTGADVPALTSREIHILDISRNGTEQRLQARSFSSLSSAVTQRSSVSAVPAAMIQLPDQHPGVRFSWHGRAEDVYGGMYRIGGAGLGRLTYERISDGVQTETVSQQADDFPAGLERLPLLAGGSQAVTAHWQHRFTDHPWIDSDLTVSGTGLLEGDIHSHLPVPIRNWVVFYGNRVYQASADAVESQRNLAPGETWNRRKDWVRASDLKSFLNGVRTIQSAKPSSGSVKGDSIQVTTPYNPRGDDPLDILTMVSLFHAAGGEAYAGVGNDALKHLELSDSIRMNCALLLGRIDLAPTQFLLDGQPTQPVTSQTIVRLLLPVTRRSAAPEAPVKPTENDTAAGSNAAAGNVISETAAQAANLPTDDSARNSAHSPVTNVANDSTPATEATTTSSPPVGPQLPTGSDP